MNLSSYLRQSAAANQDVAAILYQGLKLTYKELDEAIDRFAEGLTALGLGRDSRVALLLANSPQFVISYYAIARIGAVSVPLNPLYTPGELQYILADSAVQAVVAVQPLAPLFGMMRPVLPELKHVILVGGAAEGALEFDQVLAKSAELSDEQRAEVATVDPAESDMAVILYTSGTTGKPKGAMLSHENMCSNAFMSGSFLGFNKDDTVVTVLPMFHVFCMTVCMNAPLFQGGTLLVLPRFSPTETAKLVRETQATVFAGVPTMYNFLTQHPEVSPEDLKTVRLAISGGAALPAAVLKGFEQKFGVILSEGYGLSEASPVCAFNPIDRERKPGTIGVAVPGVELRVVGPEGEERAPHEVGELIVRGANVMMGYLNRPEDTESTLRDGWLYTGDLATVDEEGYYTIVDRKKDMIIVGGLNVYPREVEEVLFQHPAVREAAVVGVPDPNYGEEVQAYVALKTEASVDDLLAFCESRLAKYKMPKQVFIVEELPKNATGKILRRELKKVASENAAK